MISEPRSFVVGGGRKTMGGKREREREKNPPLFSCSNVKSGQGEEEPPLLKGCALPPFRDEIWRLPVRAF